MELQEGTTPAAETKVYEGHSYTIKVATGSVSLAMRNRAAVLGLNDGVRAYDEKAMHKFGRAAHNQSALSGKMLKHQQGLTRKEELDYADDLYLASSPSAVDQWLAGAQRALGKASCLVLLWQSLEHRMEDLLADAAIGSDTMLAAAAELGGMITELEALRAGVPALHTKTTVPQIIEAVHSVIRAKKNYEAAAVVMTTLANIRSSTKQLYYPSEKGNAV